MVLQDISLKILRYRSLCKTKFGAKISNLTFGSELNLSDRLLIGVRSLFYFRVDSRHLPIKFEIFLFSCFSIIVNLDINYSGLNLSYRAVTFDDF